MPHEAPRVSSGLTLRRELPLAARAAYAAAALLGSVAVWAAVHGPREPRAPASQANAPAAPATVVTAPAR